MNFFNMNSTSNQNNPNKDVLVPNCPDNISSIRFNPSQNFIVCGTWDGNICIWSLENNNAISKSNYKLNTQILDVEWVNTSILIGCCDNTGIIWNPTTSQQDKFAMHDASIKSICVLKEMQNVVATGSWDSKVKYWDLRKRGECITCQLNERVYTMDCKSYVMVTGLAGRNVHIFDIRKPNSPVKSIISPLKMQTRCVSIFKENDGYCIGSIEGRVGVRYFEDDSKSFAFKAHRVSSGTSIEKAYSVNSISFNMMHGTFSTAGSDGTIMFWDKTAKQRIKSLSKMPEPIIDTDFNSDGTLFGYACGYDYSEGYAGKTSRTHMSTQIYIRAVNLSEVQPRNSVSKF